MKQKQQKHYETPVVELTPLLQLESSFCTSGDAKGIDDFELMETNDIEWD